MRAPQVAVVPPEWLFRLRMRGAIQPLALGTTLLGGLAGLIVAARQELLAPGIVIAGLGITALIIAARAARALSLPTYGAYDAQPSELRWVIGSTVGGIPWSEITSVESTPEGMRLTLSRGQRIQIPSCTRGYGDLRDRVRAHHRGPWRDAHTTASPQSNGAVALGGMLAIASSSLLALKSVITLVLLVGFAIYLVVTTDAWIPVLVGGVSGAAIGALLALGLYARWRGEYESREQLA